jgi:hypothetical protein
MIPHQSRRLGKGRRRLSWAATVASLGLLLMVLTGCPPPTPPTPPPPSAPNAKLLCFPAFSGLPDAPNPPNVDGAIGGVPGDLGWNRSSRYVFGNGTSVPDAVVQIVRDAQFVYLSFEVNNDKSFDAEDLILLTFSPGGGATNDRRIFIFPNTDGAPDNTNQPPPLVQYWTNSGSWSGAAPANNPPWIVNNTRVKRQSDNATSRHWYVETKIPITNAASTNQATDTGINVPPASNFGFYFNIIRAQTVNGNETAIEFPWPEGVKLTGSPNSNFATPENNTPLPADWGNGTYSATACNGVNFDWYDIKIDHAGAAGVNEDQIALNQNTNVKNIFTVTPHNDSVDKNNQYVAAPGVQATFKIRNYGLNPSTQYELVGTTGGNLVAPNPTNPVTIPAATGGGSPVQGFATLSTLNWKLNGAQQTTYTNNSSQCILVELGLANNTNANVSFKNKSALRNMHFVTTASPFSQTATLGTRGFQLQPGQDALEFILNAFTAYTTSTDVWETKIENAQDLGSGQFLMRARPGEDARLATTISPPQISLPSADIGLPGAATDGRKVLTLKVRPGDLVTVLAEGSIQARKTEDPSAGLAGPNGLDTTRQSGARNVKAQYTDDKGGYPLPPRFEPERHVGAVIGSWDNFGEKTFLLGSATTLKVPKNADTLYLTLNDTADGYREHQGEGFKIQVIETPLEKVYTYANSLVSRDPTLEPLVIPLAVNLPTWVLCGEHKTGRQLKIGKRTFQEVETLGCYGYALNRIGKGDGQVPR